MNSIYLENVTTQTPIYRVFRIERLIELFETKQNVLFKPKLWDDPFENFILNAKLKDDQGHLISIAYRNQFYGQCWTMLEESDAIWRIFAPNKDGVKVRTTIQKLFDSLSLAHRSDRLRDVSDFIGMVRYHDEDELYRMINEPDRMFRKTTDPSGKSQAASLLIKRREFEHEKEVRLIHWEHRNHSSDIYKYNCDPYDLIDEIVFDPRLNDPLFNVYKEHLERKGYSKPVTKSLLYTIRRRIGRI